MAKDTANASGYTPNALSKRKQNSTGVLSMPSAGSVLITSVSCLMVLSLIMVASASIPFANMHDIKQLYFFEHQLMYMGLGLIAGFMAYKVRLLWLYDMFTLVSALLIVIALLLATLLFGDAINGSKRWIEIGPFNFQVAELAKLVMVMFTADFVVRRGTEVRHGYGGIFRMGALVTVLVGLFLSQPDFGSLVIIIGVILAIFFVAGAPWSQSGFLLLFGLVGAAYAVMFQEYRMTRATSFLDPFDDIQGSDYQLARSLIAFGRGEMTGVGYGESVQKLAHLPEAHTDFLLAITAEELGFVGVITILALEALVVASAMRISYIALKNRQMRLSYTAFGFAVIFIGQGVINAGMNMGLMPTKGLTLPFFSYGGSSMLISLIMVGILLNIHKKTSQIPTAQCRHY
ncbi:putative lipid II flippase FtsW [Psychrobacter phenylpyruvicus]|uniref:Probable peptidoglycan glycosyltransferase FtsW n=2 Tax=Psychrobacter phenylpyruvicus TaxID=29432 RepID=A0A379LPZ5_9GAMM|nr:putative lipid II flippase FtsW [Psychrobacter phenylpyruvicus]SUD91882.1 Cell division protein FtsW [Psychrobacter phenylpyruvicus]